MKNTNNELNKRLIALTILLAFTVLILGYTLSVIMFKSNYNTVSGVNNDIELMKEYIEYNKTTNALEMAEVVDNKVKFINNICFEDK